MWSRSSRGIGCTIIAAWTPSNAPRSSRSTLPPPLLLGRRTDHLHGDAELVGERGERETGAHGRGRDHVVPARMADARQRVVLRTDRDRERAGARGRDERRREVAHPGFDGERSAQSVGHPLGRALLLEGELGMGVHGVRQLDECPARGSHLPLRDGLGIHGANLATTSPHVPSPGGATAVGPLAAVVAIARVGCSARGCSNIVDESDIPVVTVPGTHRTGADHDHGCRRARPQRAAHARLGHARPLRATSLARGAVRSRSR